MMISGTEEFFAIADLCTEAALTGGWIPALQAIANACGGEIGNLIGIGADRSLPFNWLSQSAPSMLVEFAAAGGMSEVRNPRIARGLRMPVMHPWHDAQLETDEELVRNFQYADFCRRHDIAFGSQSMLFRDGRMNIGLAVLRSRRQGVPQRLERQTFEALMPVVRQAIVTQLMLEGQGAALVAGALEVMDVAAFLLDRHGRVAAQTKGAEEIVSRGLLQMKNNRLSLDNSGETRLLQDAIAAALDGGLDQGQPLLEAVITGRSGLPSRIGVIKVVRLPAPLFSLGFHPRVLVVHRSLKHNFQQLEAILSQGFGLTSAEARVAVQLASGESREAIASIRGSKIETVRGQIKSIFAKLGIRREAELVALVDLLQ